MELSRVKTSFFFMLTSLRLRASKSYNAMTLASRPASSTGAACCCWGKQTSQMSVAPWKSFHVELTSGAQFPGPLTRGKPWLEFWCGCSLTVVILQYVVTEVPITDLVDLKEWTWPTAHAQSIKSIVCSRLLLFSGKGNILLCEDSNRPHPSTFQEPENTRLTTCHHFLLSLLSLDLY